MIYFGREDAQMLGHMAETASDRIAEAPGEYEENDRAVVSAVDLMHRAGSSLVITGQPMDADLRAQMMAHIVSAELDNWVADSSQRLIYRAGRALDQKVHLPVADTKDCGAEQHWHVLIHDWCAGIYVVRCVTCQRMYRS